MLRLLFTTSTLPRFARDPEPRFVLDLARALSNRYEITILAPADPEAALEEVEQGVRIRRYRYAPLRRLEQLANPGAILPRLRQSLWMWLLVPLLFLGLYRALRRARREGYDLVHCHWLIPQGIVQVLASWSGKPPFVVTSHGGDLTSFRNPALRYLLRRVIRSAARTILVSSALKDGYEDLLADAPVIPMGVDDQRFSPTQADPTLFQQLCGDAQVILFVGRLAEKKGIPVLIEAMNQPALRECSAHLVIIGDGPMRPEIQVQLAASGLASRVHLQPPLDHHQLPAIYAAAEVFCAPSVVAKNGDTDGVPTVILEASASGTPCVCTPVGGIGEFIRDGYNGLVVEPGNAEALATALARVIKDKGLREQLSLAARSSIAAYRWPVIAERFDSVYREILDPEAQAGKAENTCESA